MNIATLLERSQSLYPDTPAVMLGDQPHLDYRALGQRVAALAAGLRQQHSLQSGDRVALYMGNGVSYPELLLAIWWAGLVAVPVNVRLAREELRYILDHSGSRLCWVDPASHAQVQGLGGDIATLEQVLVAEDDHYQNLLQTPAIPLQPRPAEALAWLFYTSGTTGRPKGACLSHRNLLAMVQGYLCEVDYLEVGERLLHAAPMSHGSGLYVLPYLARAGCQVIPVSGGFDEAEIFELIKIHPKLSLWAAPTMVHRLVRHPAARGDTSNLKTIVYGGGPMYRADLDLAHEVLGNKLVQIYGQGESPMTISVLNRAHHADVKHPRHHQRLASVGVAQLGVELRVVDHDDHPLPPGESGEVCVRGDSVMSGYWQDDPATRTALAGGWLHTGDLGFVDAEGFLTLQGRSKEMIISGGNNIYPIEVENTLTQHPLVQEAAVLGRPDPAWGETVVAFVVLAPGEHAEAAALLDAHCLVSMARYKRPREYHFVASLPKNAYGKVAKTVLREQFVTRHD